MKYLFFTVAVLALGTLIPRIHSRMLEDCIKKTGANTVDQAPVLSYEIPTTRNGQCLLACLMKKEGLMTNENKINMEMIHKGIESYKKNSREIYNIKIKIYETCKIADIHNSDECIVAKEFSECVYPKESAAGVQVFLPYESRTT